MFKKLPDDSFFEEIDPIIRAWMYNSWIQDNQEKMDYAREHGLLIGSFLNYEAVRSIIAADNPDHMMTDEEFDKLSNELLLDDKKEEIKEIPKRRRKRKLTLKNKDR